MHSRRPLIFAHRGASAYAPENTLAAFLRAIEQKADLIELDTKLSADQRVVVIHDQTVDRTTNGSGHVSKMTYQQLKSLNASFQWEEVFPNQHIPLLEEVIEACIGKIRFNIELTNFRSPFDELADRVVGIIRYYQLHDQVLVSSFHPVPLRRFHELLPEVSLGFLARQGSQGFLSRGWLGRALVPYNSHHPEKSDITTGLIASARKHGHLVFPFTVNDPVEMSDLIRMGVDGLITDDPITAHQVIDAAQFPESSSGLIDLYDKV
jgi:glycerophosphoryl diester phosphodiesterase